MSGERRPPAARVAVALAYDETAGEAPRVTATGRGELAERIIETARAHGVVIEDSPMLAAALGNLELDDQIPEELFKAVAEVIAFVLKTQRSGASGLR
jgi:flagellar biosynthesis protein